jgi:hypothetical protein
MDSFGELVDHDALGNSDRNRRLKHLDEADKGDAKWYLSCRPDGLDDEHRRWYACTCA